MTPTLKPCPFCGGAATSTKLSPRTWIVGCEGPACGPQPEVYADSLAAGAAEWNRRVPDPVALPFSNTGSAE